MTAGTGVTPALRDVLLTQVAEAARHVPRAVVVLHTPKSAGTALFQTARAAGWSALSADGLVSALGRCRVCAGRPRAMEVEWRPRRHSEAAGLHLDIEHHPLALALAAADVLTAAGCDVRILMTVRAPVDRLVSLFRFYWRDAYVGGVATLARALGRGARRSLGMRTLETLPSSRRLLGARDHGGRIARLRALDALNYAVHRDGGLVIDGSGWLAAFERFGAGPGTRYWLDEFGVTPDRLARLRDDGRLELVAPARLDDLTISLYGRRTQRANVSSDHLHPAVETALVAMRDELVALARRDEPFAGLIAKAGT